MSESTIDRGIIAAISDHAGKSIELAQREYDHAVRTLAIRRRALRGILAPDVELDLWGCPTKPTAEPRPRQFRPCNRTGLLAFLVSR